jgi:hypothetical protein
MLDITSNSIGFNTPFEVILTVTSDEVTPITTVPIVEADFNDPGVTVIVSSGGVITINGSYEAIIPITWEWLDLNRNLKFGDTVPEVGTYEKIVKVESPSFLSKICTYTITSDAGTDTFQHTVSLSSWSVIAESLTTALAGAK